MPDAVAVKSAVRIPHLGDRPAALESLGWTGRDAEWIAKQIMSSRLRGSSASLMVAHSVMLRVTSTLPRVALE